MWTKKSPTSSVRFEEKKELIYFFIESEGCEGRKGGEHEYRTNQSNVSKALRHGGQGQALNYTNLDADIF